MLETVPVHHATFAETMVIEGGAFLLAESVPPVLTFVVDVHLVVMECV